MRVNLVVDRCDFQPGNIIDNKYTVKERLGKGSFGTVYLVEDSYKSLYALKILRLWEVSSEIRPELIKRFEQESHVGQIELSNLHLVHSLKYSTVGGNPYFLMDYCPGGDLQPYLGKPEGKASQICNDILSGLHVLHQNGIVHRDLKPENVLFRENGVAALTDFGISGDFNHRMTQMNFLGKPNQIFGTWAYMPPEQVKRARGNATVLPTTDIFSFGVLTYQLLTGRLPFGTLESYNDVGEYTDRGKKGQWDRLPLRNIENGQQWLKLISACLVPDYKERIQTVEEVSQLVPQSSQVPKIELKPIYSQTAVTHGFQLHILKGEEHGRLFDLTKLMQQRGRRVLSVGRQSDNNVFIRCSYSNYLSRHHATLEASANGQKWVVRDGQWDDVTQRWHFSSNGTYVNSKPVHSEGLYLQPGDIITMGDVTLRFENY